MTLLIQKIKVWLKNPPHNELLRKVSALIFPEFSNKLTWCVTLTGITLVAVPSVPILILSIGAGLWNQNFGEPFSIPPVPEISPWIGVALIGMGLIHNLGYRHTSIGPPVVQNHHDLALKAVFLEELPSNSSLIQLLKDHDFGHSFPTAPIFQMDHFLFKWEGAEFQFHTENIQLSSLSFRVSLKALTKKISNMCGPAHSVNRLTAIPDHLKNEFDWPEDLTRTIRDLNESATLAFQKHQELVAALSKLQ